MKRLLRFVLAALPILFSGVAVSQQQQVFFPPNIILPNNETIAIGTVSGLEGNAFIARADDSTAPWFDPAGLARAKSSTVSASAGTFQFLTVVPEGFDNNGGSVNQLGSTVGVVAKRPFHLEKWTFGFAVMRTAAWEQSTNENLVTPGSLPSRTTLAADATFNRTTAALSAGWGEEEGLRLGGALLVDVLNLESSESLSYRKETPTYVQTFVGSNRSSGGQATVRLGLGVQYDASKNLKLGAVIRTPGFRIFPSAFYSVDLVDQRGAVSRQVSFFDASTATFRYKLPFELGAGIAWVAEAFSFELDVKGQTAVAAYDGFTSPQPVILISDPGNGSKAEVTTMPFPGRTFEGRAGVNISVGGHMRLDRKGVWKLHAGFSTDNSPVGDADQYFNRINLRTATFGVSGAALHLVGTLGMVYQFGTSDEQKVPDFGGGAFVTTTYKVTNFGIVYSLSYVF